RVYATTAEGVQSVSADFTFTTPSPSTPHLPQTFLDTTYVPNSGPVVHVTAGDDLQDVLDAAVPGETIVLDASATFTGDFILRNKPGNQWIYIVSSALASLPAPGTRVTPANSALMPKIVSPDLASAISTDAGAHHYRFIGVELATSWSLQTDTNFAVV